MEHNKYLEIWTAIQPAMTERLTALVDAIGSQLPQGFTISAPKALTDGDEFRVSTDIHIDGKLLLGLDFTLVDGGLHEDEDGVAISLLSLGYAGTVHGGYFPENYTPQVWTTDVSELLSRIDRLPVEDLALSTVKDCLERGARIAADQAV